jgi:RNA recognition motif-containing protein
MIILIYKRLFANGKHFSMEDVDRDDAMEDLSLEQWHEFLITPPSWEPSNIETPMISSFFEWLPAALLADLPSSPVQDSGSDSDDPALTSFRLLLDENDYPKDPETRSIQFTNLDPQTTANDLTESLKGYGEIDSIDISNGSAIVRFYDIRVAQAVRRTRFCLRSRCLGVTYGPTLEITNPRKPPNNGTIVVFHLRKGVSDEGVHKEFSQFGLIRQIRCAPGKMTQRFIEYYDVRAAQAAVQGMKGKKIFRSKISVEFSLPGRFRKGQEQQASLKLPIIERVSKTHTPFAISY